MENKLILRKSIVYTSALKGGVSLDRLKMRLKYKITFDTPFTTYKLFINYN